MEAKAEKSVSLFKNIVFSTFLLLSTSVAFFVDQPIILLLVFLTICASFYLVVNNFAVSHYHLVVLLIFLSLLTPPIEVSSSFPKIRAEEFIIYLFFPLLFIFRVNTFSFNAVTYRFIKLFSALILVAITSTIYGKIFLGVPVGLRDLFEIITLSKYLFAFIIVYNLNISGSEIRSILWLVLVIITISGLFGLVQFFGIFGIDKYTAQIFLSERAHIVNDRLTGTFKNPNSYSVILVIGHIISSVLLIFEKENRKRIILSFLMLFFFACLIYAGSRTMIAAYIFISALLLLIAIYDRGIKLRYLFLIFGIMSLVFMIVIATLSDQILLRLQSGTDILGDESFGMRIIIWFLNLKIFAVSPIIGWGPAKDLYTTIVDSEYILILRRYGIIGFIFYLSIFVYPLYIAVSRLRKDSNIESLVIAIIIVCFLITNLTNNILHNIQTMDFWIILLALFFKTFDYLHTPKNLPENFINPSKQI